ncbi:MAG: mechanosensitive ion channel family protein [Lentisphaeria bacterium]|nr:mechanosensitive ion channel family protein [Lentisphaeria bacterium]
MFSFFVLADAAACAVNNDVSFSGLWCRSVSWVVRNQEGLLMLLVCAVAAIPVSIIISWILRGSINAMLTRSHREEKKISSTITKPILFAGILTGIRIGLNSVDVSEEMMDIFSDVYFLFIVLAVAWALLRVLKAVRYLLQDVAAKTENVYDDLLVSLIYPVLKCIIWVVAVLFIAENTFNFQVTSLLAGAGVAAMAIAFAAQNTIANVFGALALISDRPFGIGDMISFNGKRGSVVSIGLRSTTLRTLDGTVWSVPNKEVAEASIENISRRPNIKWAFNIDLVYGTAPEQISRAKEIVIEILLASPLTDPEKNAPAVWFSEYAESSLRLSVINWFQTTSWADFCQQREEIQLKILQRLEEEKLELAFNTQTVHLVQETK